MAPQSPETLFLRYREAGDVGALAQVFDRLAPELLRLAKRLIRPADLAEDLVQETFMVALEKREQFDPAERLEPWLIGILVNRARSVRRRERRVIEPDQLAERDVEQPEVELDRDERRAALAEALDELPKSMRAVVEAKLAGRDAGEAARELGISSGAARVRLHRALARMRMVLPPSLATPFALLLMHTTGLGAARGRVLRSAVDRLEGGAARGASATGLGLFPGLAIGWAWMTKQTLAAAVVLAGLVSVGVGLGFGVEPNRGIEMAGDAAAALAIAPATAPRPEPSEVDAGDLAIGGRVTAAPAAGVEAAAPGAPNSLTGTVLGPDGEPFAGAEVDVWFTFDHREYLTEGPDRTVVADGNGEFRLNQLGDYFIVSARSEGLACERGLTGRVAAGVHAEGLTLALTPAVSRSGAVVGPSGEPLEGVEVFAGDHRQGQRRTEYERLNTVPGLRAYAITDAAGQFELTGLSVGNPRVLATKSGYLEYRDHLTPGGSGTPYQVDGRVVTPRAIAPEDVEGSVQLHLGSGLVVAGRVLDHRGQPAAGARVRRIFGDPTFPEAVLTDADGRFALRGMRADQEYEQGILVELEGHAVEVVQPVKTEPVETEAVEDVGPAGRREVTVRLNRERVLGGVLVAPDGAPAPGVTLRITGKREMYPGYSTSVKTTWEWFAERSEVVTDEAGAFRFDGLYRGTFQIETVSTEARELSPREHMSQDVKAGDEDLRLVLGETPGRVTVVGSVLDATTGLPIEGFWVTPMIGPADSAGGVGVWFDGGDGAFEIAGLEPGYVQVTYRAEGYAERQERRVKLEPGVHAFEARLSPARSLQLSFARADGEEVGGNVRAFDQDGQPLDLVVSSGAGGRVTSETAMIPGGGRVLEGLPAERVTIQFERDHRFELDLSKPGPHEARLLLDAVAMTDLHLLVLTEGGLSDQLDLIDVWRELGGNAFQIAAARPDLAQCDGLEDLLDREVMLLLTDGKDRELVGVTLRPGELSFDREFVTLGTRAEELSLEFDRAFPHVGFNVPTGVVRIYLTGFEEELLPSGLTRVRELERELVRELELTDVGGEVFEGLILEAD